MKDGRPRGTTLLYGAFAPPLFAVTGKPGGKTAALGSDLRRFSFSIFQPGMPLYQKERGAYSSSARGDTKDLGLLGLVF